MKKLFLLAVLLSLHTTCLWAQKQDFRIILLAGDEKFGIQGGKEGKSYMVVYKSNKNRVALYNATVNYMSEMGLVDKNKVKGKKVGNGMTEVVIPFRMNTGIGTTGGSAPLHLHGDMRFEFYDGGMRLKVENFDEEFFLVHYKPEMGQKGTATYEKYLDYVKQANNAGKATSGYGKFIAKMDKLTEITHISNRNGSVVKDAKRQVSAKLNEADQERMKVLDDYRSRVKEQEALFTKMRAANEGRWYTLPLYIKAAEECEYFAKNQKAGRALLNYYNNALAAHKLLALPQKRWARDVRYIFDGVFITLAEKIGGSIEEIAEDGSTTWERDGDLIVPCDSKKRAKYLKKGKSFLDYEAYE